MGRCTKYASHNLLDLLHGYLRRCVSLGSEGRNDISLWSDYIGLIDVIPCLAISLVKLISYTGLGKRWLF